MPSFRTVQFAVSVCQHCLLSSMTSLNLRQGRSTILSLWKHNLIAIVSADSVKSLHLTVMESAPPVSVCAYRDDRFAVRRRGTRWLLVPKTWQRSSVFSAALNRAAVAQLLTNAAWARVRIIKLRRLAGDEPRRRTHLTASSLDVNFPVNFRCGGIQGGRRSPGDGERKECGDCQRASHPIRFVWRCRDVVSRESVNLSTTKFHFTVSKWKTAGRRTCRIRKPNKIHFHDNHVALFMMYTFR